MLINRFKKVFNNETAYISVTESLLILTMMFVIIAWVLSIGMKVHITMSEAMDDIDAISMTTSENIANNSQNKVTNDTTTKPEEKEVIKNNPQTADAKEEPKDTVNGLSDFFQQFCVELLAGATLSVMGFVIGKVFHKKKTNLNMNKN